MEYTNQYQVAYGMCTPPSIYCEGRSVLKMSVYKYHLPSTLFQTTTYLPSKNTNCNSNTWSHAHSWVITHCCDVGMEAGKTKSYCHRTAISTNSQWVVQCTHTSYRDWYCIDWDGYHDYTQWCNTRRPRQFKKGWKHSVQEWLLQYHTFQVVLNRETFQGCHNK